MQIINDKDVVTILFEGKTVEGEVFDVAKEDNPMTFEVGSSVILPAFSKAIIGMQKGDSKSFQLAAEDAFGEKKEELIQTIDKSTFNQNINPQIGMILGLNVEQDGQQLQVPATVIAVDNDTITVDYNHPLAGKSVTFDVTVVDIKANPES